MPLETPRTYVSLTFEPDDPPPPRSPYKRVVGGIAAIAVLAVAGGFLLPMIGHERPPAKPASPAVTVPTARAPAASGSLNIVVDSSPPPAEANVARPPAAETVIRESVQPPAPSPPAEKPRPKASASAAPTPHVSPPADMAPSPQIVPSPDAVPAPVIAPAPAVRPYTPTLPPTVRSVGSARPSFNCRYARTTSELMVCADPRLAAADRRMVRAYQQALRRGVPEPYLRHQQDIWLGVREAAAREGPEGVARTYAQRTAELQALAR